MTLIPPECSGLADTRWRKAAKDRYQLPLCSGTRKASGTMTTSRIPTTTQRIWAWAMPGSALRLRMAVTVETEKMMPMKTNI